jgi:hypothetical protein
VRSRNLLSERWEVRFNGVELHRYASRAEAQAKRDYLAALDLAASYSVYSVRRYRLCTKK